MSSDHQEKLKYRQHSPQFLKAYFSFKTDLLQSALPTATIGTQKSNPPTKIFHHEVMQH